MVIRSHSRRRHHQTVSGLSAKFIAELIASGVDHVKACRFYIHNKRSVDGCLANGVSPEALATVLLTFTVRIH